MTEPERIVLPKTGEHYVAPLGRICDCPNGCFRTIPQEASLCIPCELGYHGPGGRHGYAQGGEEA